MQAPGVDLTVGRRLLDHLRASGPQTSGFLGLSSSPMSSLLSPSSTAVRASTSTPSPRPASAGRASLGSSPPPPRPASNPETTFGTFTVAIRKASGESVDSAAAAHDQATTEDEDLDEDEEDSSGGAQEAPDRAVAAGEGGEEGVWRPF